MDSAMIWNRTGWNILIRDQQFHSLSTIVQGQHDLVLLLSRIGLYLLQHCFFFTMQKVAVFWKQACTEHDLCAFCEKLHSLASVLQLWVTVNLNSFFGWKVTVSINTQCPYLLDALQRLVLLYLMENRATELLVAWRSWVLFKYVGRHLW